MTDNASNHYKQSQSTNSLVSVSCVLCLDVYTCVLHSRGIPDITKLCTTSSYCGGPRVLQVGPSKCWSFAATRLEGRQASSVMQGRHAPGRVRHRVTRSYWAMKLRRRNRRPVVESLIPQTVADWNKILDLGLHAGLNRGYGQNKTGGFNSTSSRRCTLRDSGSALRGVMMMFL